jgi:hypothetical protein
MPRRRRGSRDVRCVRSASAGRVRLRRGSVDREVHTGIRTTRGDIPTARVRRRRGGRALRLLCVLTNASCGVFVITWSTRIQEAISDE